ncbi:MAG: hypothetical protein EON52_02475 [Actinomycetales bacterium]|nr:MAG: hypothetical protein EON52_02475 [Actinomycetales bacterium]
MRVLVFCDVTDPWSYVGVTRLERAAATFTILVGEPVEIAFRAAVPGERADVRDAVAAARISGIDLDVEDLVPADPTDAWRLLTWAAESGDGVQRDLLHQLWRAHFLEGADIADPFVLGSRAALVGLELETAEALVASDEYAAPVVLQRETAESLGVAELPHVVVENTWTLVGLRSQDDYVQALHQIHREWSEQG